MTATVSNTSSALATNELITELVGTESNIDMMIGVGLNKASDAVFFQYLGDGKQPSALMLPSGKPLSRIANVQLTGISVVDGVGEYSSTKLNLYLTTTQGTTVMITSGLTTLWSQFVVTGLMAMFSQHGVDGLFTLDSWKGTSKQRPCFAAVRVGKQKLTDEMFKQQLQDYRSDGASDKVAATMRDAVNILSAAVSGAPVDEVTVDVQDSDSDIDF